MRHFAIRSGASAACVLALAAALGLSSAPRAGAQTPPSQPVSPPKTGPSMAAFQDAYAVSFYGFDACGDQVAGKIYRKALTERFASCPFPPEARAHFRQWSTAQRRKSSGAMTQLVEQNGGGLPVKLDGMSNTCREQRSSPDYIAFRSKLQQYDDGLIHADAIVPQPCDAASISP